VFLPLRICRANADVRFRACRPLKTGANIAIPVIAVNPLYYRVPTKASPPIWWTRGARKR
jgi:hypothetical protein